MNSQSMLFENMLLPLFKKLLNYRYTIINIDLEQSEQRITAGTKALVLQHTFGIPADIDAALDLARRHNLVLIEDCVHALGAIYNGRPVGSFGRATFFSSEETKTISTTMGGVVVTDDAELATRVQGFQQSCAYPSAEQCSSCLGSTSTPSAGNIGCPISISDCGTRREQNHTCNNISFVLGEQNLHLAACSKCIP